MYGEKFSPYRLSELSNVTFDDPIEPGVTVMARGPHKGKLAPYGSASMKDNSCAERGVYYNDALNKLLLSFQRKVHDYTAESGVDQTTLWMTFFFDNDGQLGLEFRPDNLRLLGEMGMTICIDVDRQETH